MLRLDTLTVALSRAATRPCPRIYIEPAAIDGSNPDESRGLRG